MTLVSRRTLMAGGLGVGIATLTSSWALASLALLSPTTMRDDVGLLRRAYETLHPGLLRYQTASQSARRFDALNDACARPMTLSAFYLLLSRHLASVRCGHSYANFFNQSGEVRSALFDAPGRLPLMFLWLGSRMVVTADPLGTGVAPGSEVLTVNGRPAGQVLASLMAIARADGHNDAKRRRLLSVQGDDAYETFDIFYPLIFGDSGRYELVVAGLDGKRRTVVLRPASLADRRSGRTQTTAAASTPWTLRRDGRTAILTMTTWGLYDSKWDWRGWLDASFDRLAADRVARLVIDLRANEGGLDDCGDALAARFVRRSVPFDTARRLVRYQRVPSDLRPHLDTWDRRFDDWGASAQPFDARFFELVGEQEGTKTITPANRRFEGEVIVLTGPQNSSATFGFARLMRRERLATLIGQTTGGNKRGINGSGFYFLRLPGSGLEVDLPLVGTFPLAPERDGGIRPDRLIAPSRRDIGAGRDAVLATII